MLAKQAVPGNERHPIHWNTNHLVGLTTRETFPIARSARRPVPIVKLVDDRLLERDRGAGGPQGVAQLFRIQRVEVFGDHGS